MAHIFIMYLISNIQSQNTHIIAFPKFLVLKSCFKNNISKSIYIDSRFFNISRWRLRVIVYDMMQAIEREKRLNYL